MKGGKKILFVDDDEDDRDLIYESLVATSPEVEAVFAGNGLEALDFLQNMQQKETRLPCLIVLDLNMPFMDGRQTFDKLKNDGQLSKVPIIIFTSSQSPHDKALFESRGAEFISKPIEYSYLKLIVNHMVSVCCNC